MNKRRIAILMHEADLRRKQRFVITLLAQHWREDGHEVIFLFGTRTFVPADLVILHVDLSVVPDSYLDFARRYPIVLNREIRDIRKSSFSQNLLRSGDPYDGPVIVKTDLNCAGAPERWTQQGGRGPGRELLHVLRTFMQPRRGKWDFKRPTDYSVFDHLSQIPPSCFEQPGIVVQKFQPEMQQRLYCVRNLSFLGNRVSCVRLIGPHPIVNGDTAQITERIEPDAEILALRQQLKFDYGKFDYVVVDGKVILLDINKTVGCSSRLLDSAELRQLRRYRAQGLYEFFA